MLKIYFDNTLIDEDSYTALSNDYKLFTDTFKLGSVASNSFKLSINKTMVISQPIEVRIEDDNTTFYLIVDSVEEDKNDYIYTLTDKLVNFNFNYDASELINAKQELEETCYLSDIWKDMCEKASVEYDDTYTFLNDIEVSWYDNTIQARKYLSYIAELQGGYACILENGKQTFKPYKKSSSQTIDVDECSDFIIGEKKKITRVVYDNGVTKWEFGSDTGTTLYIDSSNVFITDETVVENIYDLIAGFEFYLLDIPNAPMDSSVRAGDIITFIDGEKDYPTIAQYSRTFFGSWVGSFSLDIKTDKQVETNVINSKEKILKIQTDINRMDGILQITSEKADENESNVSQLTIASDEIKTTVQSQTQDLTNMQSQINDNLGEMNTLTEAINTINSTMSTQTSEAFEFLFTQTGIQEAVNHIQEALNGNNESLNTITEYIRFEGAEITLGKSTSQTKLVIKNDRISFMTGNNESAYISENTLYITDSTILNKLQIGHWEEKEDQYGNLNTRWIGGAN